jgi:hypothetical protein
LVTGSVRRRRLANADAALAAGQDQRLGARVRRPTGLSCAPADQGRGRQLPRTRQRVGRDAGRAERLERSETFGSKGFASILSHSRSMQYRFFLSVSRAIGAEANIMAHPTRHCLEHGMTCAGRASSLPRPTTSNAETQFIGRCASDASQRSDSGSTARFRAARPGCGQTEAEFGGRYARAALLGSCYAIYDNRL